MIFNNYATPPGGFCLVLLDGTEKDILGIWGPYPTEAVAQAVLKELNLWPIDGIWDLHALKYFPAPPAATYPPDGLHPRVSWQ